MALEPRFMFDAAGLASGADLAEQQMADGLSEQLGDGGVETALATQAENELFDAMALFEEPGGSKSYVFIDGTVENYQDLLGMIGGDAEIIVIHPDSNGLQVIADSLSGQTGLQSIHIISPGESGSVSLGGMTLSQETLGDHAGLLKEIGQALSSSGDILFYGSSIGEGAAGEDFTKALAEATGADIAVSIDATGASDLGGDWDLELQIGSIEEPSLESASYAGLLDPQAPEDEAGGGGTPPPPSGGGSTGGGSTGGGTAGGGGSTGGGTAGGGGSTGGGSTGGGSTGGGSTGGGTAGGGSVPSGEAGAIGGSGAVSVPASLQLTNLGDHFG